MGGGVGAAAVGQNLGTSSSSSAPTAHIKQIIFHLESISIVSATLQFTHAHTSSTVESSFLVYLFVLVNRSGRIVITSEKSVQQVSFLVNLLVIAGQILTANNLSYLSEERSLKKSYSFFKLFSQP